MDDPIAIHYEISKNILYSLIASIVFYYVNVIYPSVLNDKKYRDLIIEKYKQMKTHITTHVFFILNNNDQEVFLNYFPDSKQPLSPVKLRYFFYGKRYYDFDPTGDILQHPETDKENLYEILNEVVHFNNFFQINKHQIYLSEKAKNIFIDLERLTVDATHKNQYIGLLVSKILLAENFSQEKKFSEDIFLYYLNEKNYTDKKYDHIKFYLCATYFLFWVIFAINTMYSA